MGEYIKRKSSTDAGPPTCRLTGDKCPVCGDRLVTEGAAVWCMRRDAPVQPCKYLVSAIRNVDRR